MQRRLQPKSEPREGCANNAGAASNSDQKSSPSTNSEASKPVTVSHPIHFGFLFTIGIGIAMGLLFIAQNTTQLLVWMLTALFIALGLDPVVRWMERRKIPRVASILTIVVVVIGTVTAFFATLIPTIVDQTTQLVERAPLWGQQFLDSDFFRAIDNQFGIRNRMLEELNKFATDSQAVGGVFGGVLNVGSTIANGLFGALIVTVLSLYFLSSLPAMKQWAYQLAPRSRRNRVKELSEQITHSVGNYVMGQACVAFLNALFAFIVMSIVGVPFSILLAFLVAFLAFIPLVGGVIAGVLVTLIAFSGGWQPALIYAICYFGYLQFEAYVVSPRIMQHAVAVPGAVVVISVIAGGSLLGVLGALIAIPTAASIMLLIKEIVLKRQDQR
ncbi:AI-2E family transporter [Acaricomes phytoseiuli]|uniref:AI-2E family transporter n=1 Tax=Acaricomes phytoseiuli TaxID=291968 RepID=UPI0003823CDB